jgi:hypothetical protein
VRFQGFTEASNLVNFWICGDPQSTGTSSHACSCQHEWVVYSLALAEGWLMLQCVECGLMGTVENPSKEEWSQGFNAPSTPYRWLDEARVVHKQPAPFCVIRALDSPACPCPRQTMLPRSVFVPANQWISQTPVVARNPGRVGSEKADQP